MLEGFQEGATPALLFPTSHRSSAVAPSRSPLILSPTSKHTLPPDTTLTLPPDTTLAVSLVEVALVAASGLNALRSMLHPIPSHCSYPRAPPSSLFLTTSRANISKPFSNFFPQNPSNTLLTTSRVGTATTSPARAAGRGGAGGCLGPAPHAPSHPIPSHRSSPRAPSLSLFLTTVVGVCRLWTGCLPSLTSLNVF